MNMASRRIKPRDLSPDLVSAQPSASVSSLSNSVMGFLSSLQEPQHTRPSQQLPYGLLRLNGGFSLRFSRSAEWWNAWSRPHTEVYAEELSIRPHLKCCPAFADV